MNAAKHRISVILFDYGGVLADEGFRDGLTEIARRNGLNPASLLQSAMDAVYHSGYVLGTGSEEDFWRMLKDRSGIEGETSQLRKEIFQRFRIRSWMLDIVDGLKASGYITGILSDQTDWLDELEARDHFFQHFDAVFNSYHLGMGKRDPAIFHRVADRLHVAPENILFIDDSPGNIERAQAMGLQTILFRNRQQFEHELKSLLPD